MPPRCFVSVRYNDVIQLWWVIVCSRSYSHSEVLSNSRCWKQLGQRMYVVIHSDPVMLIYFYLIQLDYTEDMSAVHCKLWLDINHLVFSRCRTDWTNPCISLQVAPHYLSLIFYFARNVFISNLRHAMPSRVFKCSIPWEVEQVLAWVVTSRETSGNMYSITLINWSCIQSIAPGLFRSSLITCCPHSQYYPLPRFVFI